MPSSLRRVVLEHGSGMRVICGTLEVQADAPRVLEGVQEKGRAYVGAVLTRDEPRYIYYQLLEGPVAP